MIENKFIYGVVKAITAFFYLLHVKIAYHFMLIAI